MRLIDADELVKKACTVCGYGDGEGACAILCGLAKVIDSMPTIEAEPVRHGNWVNSFVGMYACSKCGVNDRFGLSRYCPNCGAKMDGGASDA